MLADDDYYFSHLLVVVVVVVVQYGYATCFTWKCRLGVYNRFRNRKERKR